MTGDRPGRTGSVQSVDRALAVLEVLIEDSRPFTALEISKRTGLERTIVHRLLRSLSGHQFVAKDDTGRYRLGPYALRVGNAYLDRLPVRRIFLPYVVDLSNRVASDKPWVVGVAVPVDRVAIVVDRLWHASASLDSVLNIGTRLPLTGSATGRALLARYDDAQAVALIGTEAFEKLRPRLEEIRARGYLEFATSELRPGVSAMAASVGDDQRQPTGAVSIVGLNLEAELHDASELAQHLRRTADVLTSVLEHRAAY